MFSVNKPAPLHPARIFCWVIPSSLATANLSTHSTFWTLEIPLRTKREICFEIACFKGEKTLTSRGCNRCEECGGRRRRLIRLLIQKLTNSAETWLSCPSQTRRRYWLQLVSCGRFKMLNPFHTMIIVCPPGTSISSQHPSLWHWLWQPVAHQIPTFENDIRRDVFCSCGWQ